MDGTKLEVTIMQPFGTIDKSVHFIQQCHNNVFVAADLSELSDASDEHCDLVALGPGARRAHLGPDKVFGGVTPAGSDEEAGLPVKYLKVPEHLQGWEFV